MDHNRASTYRRCLVVKFFVLDSVEGASLTSSSCRNEKFGHSQRTRKAERERERERENTVLEIQGEFKGQLVTRDLHAAISRGKLARVNDAESRSSGLRRRGSARASARKAITRNAISKCQSAANLRAPRGIFSVFRSRPIFANGARPCERAAERFGSGVRRDPSSPFQFS